MHLTVFVSVAWVTALVSGHPGKDHNDDALLRRTFLQQNPSDLTHCAAKLRAWGWEIRSVQRRADHFATFAKQGALLGRDAASVLSTSHESHETYTPETPEATVFASNKSCVLSPESTEGPYYVAGELVRPDLRDGQAGVLLVMDIQVVDVKTCDPVPDAHVEIWHCNSTGVYSGVSAPGNGNSASDLTNLDSTVGRGVQRTSSHGATQFVSLFPGHYAGRTPHIHVMVHIGATALPNGTLQSTTAAHVGQLYFDQALVDAVEATAPYSSNRQPLTTNARDGLLAQDLEAGSDPFMQYRRLGEGLEEGLFAWLSLGIDTTLARNVSAAETLYGAGQPSATDLSSILTSVSVSG